MKDKLKKKKIVVRMRGGLGNQLFILAFAYKLQKELQSDSVEIVLDIREYKTYKIRGFELDGLLEPSFVRMYDEMKDKSILYDVSRKLYHIVQYLIKNQNVYDFCFWHLSKIGLYYSGRNDKKHKLSRHNSTFYIYGYFQDIGILNDVGTKFMEKLKFGNVVGDVCREYLSRINEESIKIAVSVRCGEDYVRNNWSVCGETYYKEGIAEILKRKYGNCAQKVLILADNIVRAREMNIAADVVYLENINAIEQLFIMSKCEDFVISNSSFAWWGAFLGKKSTSIIIAPEQWYGTGEKTQETSLMYEGMTIL